MQDSKGELTKARAAARLNGGIEWWTTIPFAAVHLACLGVLWVGWSWTAVAVCFALYGIRMFAITGFYHRYLSHRSYKTSRWFQFLFSLVGASSTQKGPIWWASHHRHHHLYSDQENDTHSPLQAGFWYSHIGWVFARGNAESRSRLVPDLMKYPELRVLNRFDTLVPILLGTATFGLGVLLQTVAPSLGTSGPQMLVWGYFISTTLLAHGTFTINSLSHVLGTRRYETKDTSTNNWYLALITMGEGWHNNHHHYPTSARQGFFWWEIDLTYYGLYLLSKLGLIWDLKRVPAHILEQGRVTAEAEAAA